MISQTANKTKQGRAIDKQERYSQQSINPIDAGLAGDVRKEVPDSNMDLDSLPLHCFC